MKKQFLITGLFFLICLIFPTIINAQNKTLEFSVQCKILDSAILYVTDGKSVRYTHYTGGYQKGDAMNIVFKYKFYEYESISNTFNLHIFDQKSQKASVLNAMADAEDFDQKLEDSMVYRSSHSNMVLSKNNMDIEGIGSSIVLNRFYRDDWEGVFTRARKSSTHVMTMSCLGISNKYNTLLNNLQNFHD